ncbi:helix-turn-helix domain-containing protein [Sphingomonas sp. MMS12-HWE2-04]|uniref:helix-turn-helix domain-containing protein n=1 Tax=Sphingomonas sp. MMS12-HWE2-04 TaxID=3234199 RepID=UPI00384F32EC
MPATQKFRFHHYSSADIAPGQRHEAWENRFWPSLAPLYETRPLTPFGVESAQVQLGEVQLIFASISGQRWERSATIARRREHDALGVNISIDIHAQGRMGARDVVQVPGGAILVDLAQVSVHQSTDGLSIQLLFPRRMALDAGLDVGELHGLMLAPHTAAMLGSHALQLRQALPHMEAHHGVFAGRTLLDLLVLAVHSTGRAESGMAAALASTLAMRARNEIRDNLGSPMLSVATLCRRLRVSRSTLHRLFDEEGGVQAHIRNARLDAARAALLAGGVERIGDIAERLGFSDAAHLSRLFRARFGETPSDCRARGFAGR